jgi:di/tricarboxylate transporter
MSLGTQLRLSVITALALLWVLEPWHLRWWMIDVVVGVVFFAFSYLRDPTRPKPSRVWSGLAASTAVWLLGVLVARSKGLTVEGLSRDRSLHVMLRGLPDYALIFATMSALFASWSLLPRSVEGKNGA